jgi:hypothetical protein
MNFWDFLFQFQQEKGPDHGRPGPTTGNNRSGTGASSVPDGVALTTIPPIPDARIGAGADSRLVKLYRQAYDETRYSGARYYKAFHAGPEIHEQIADARQHDQTRKRSEVVLGYRVWRVSSIDVEPAPVPRLVSLHLDRLWVPGEPMRGKIDLDHPARMLGVHAYAESGEEILGELRMMRHGCTLVVGTVSLWGRVIILQKGYRAEMAYPRDLCWTNSDDPGLLQELARTYGCGVWRP